MPLLRATTYEQCQDPNNIYDGDILLMAYKDGDEEDDFVRPSNLLGDNGSFDRIQVMRICNLIDDNDKHLQTFQSYNFSNGAKTLQNMTINTYLTIGAEQDSFTGFPIVNAPEAANPNADQWPLGYLSIEPTLPDQEVEEEVEAYENTNNNFNEEITRSPSGYSKLYLYKVRPTGQQNGVMTNGQAIWTAIEANSGEGGNGTEGYWEIAGIGSTLPLAYDPAYTNSDIAATPLFSGAKVNFYDPCRWKLMSRNNVGFSEGNSPFSVQQSYAATGNEAGDYFSRDCPANGDNETPVLKTAAVYNYPAQDSCEDPLIATPVNNSDFLKIGAEVRFEDEDGWYMLRSTKTILFIVFIVLFFVFLIAMLVCGYFIMTYPEDKLAVKTKSSAPSNEMAQFQARNQRQLSPGYEEPPPAQRQLSGSDRAAATRNGYAYGNRNMQPSYGEPVHHMNDSVVVPPYRPTPRTSAPTSSVPPYRNPAGQSQRYTM